MTQQNAWTGVIFLMYRFTLISSMLKLSCADIKTKECLLFEPQLNFHAIVYTSHLFKNVQSNWFYQLSCSTLLCVKVSCVARCCVYY